MDFPVPGLHDKTVPTKVPLLMDPAHNHSDTEHVTIHITSSCDASSSSSSSSHERPSVLDPQYIHDQPSTSSRAHVYQPQLFTGPNSQNPPLIQRGNRQPRQRSPLKSVLWISIELVLTVSQIIAAILVMSFSRHEKPRAPLRIWVEGYASGCFLIIPLQYWRFRNRNQGPEMDSSQHLPDSSQANDSDAPLTRRAVDEEERWTNGLSVRGGQSNVLTHPRLNTFVEYIKMALDCFFAVWFVVGNVWVFGGHVSSNEAPNLYRLCIVFLTFSCIGYAMPFILCATICCCLPCIISILGSREDLSRNRGATQDSINSLPTYKFKVRKNIGRKGKEHSSSVAESGIVAAGTEKERAISGEDAVCCICLAKYVNNDDLRELHCSHFFHKDCLDKWLKINASCPLCKAEVGETLFNTLPETTAGVRNNIIL